jgi:hypothetical protein
MLLGTVTHSLDRIARHYTLYGVVGGQRLRSTFPGSWCGGGAAKHKDLKKNCCWGITGSRPPTMVQYIKLVVRKGYWSITLFHCRTSGLLVLHVTMGDLGARGVILLAYLRLQKTDLLLVNSKDATYLLALQSLSLGA